MKELQINTARSGGPGGQHVNKVETKVILRWNIKDSLVLTDEQKQRLGEALEKRINKAGELIISVDSQRSQLKNKTIAYKKLDRLINKAFAEKKKRVATKPSKAAKRKRLSDKKMHSQKKELRKNPDF